MTDQTARPRRRLSSPTTARPASINSQVSGSGTGETPNAANAAPAINWCARPDGCNASENAELLHYTPVVPRKPAQG